MLTSTLGPSPSHWTLYSPGFSVVPFTITGLVSSRLAGLVAARALEANSKAAPSTRGFEIETVANFMTAPFSFPKLRRETVGAAQVHDWREKTLVFCRESPTIHALGVQRTSRQACRAVLGVFSP